MYKLETINNTDHKLIMPDYFQDYSNEIESKGWFNDVYISANNNLYNLCFYDPVRLSQDISEELRNGFCILEANSIVVPKITYNEIKMAISRIVDRKEYQNFLIVTEETAREVEKRLL